MKNTEYQMIIPLVYFFAWLRSRDEAKIKNQSKQNKYADPGNRHTMYNCMGHKESFSPVGPGYTRG
jgi:hypothetical protein